MCLGVRGGTASKSRVSEGADHLPPRSYLVRPVLLVNMENMDAKPVPLLKGPFAERAGKFPVTLIHAGGVLEMLISVISVGKHFSTSFTSVTFCRLCQTQGENTGWGGTWGALSANFPHWYTSSKAILKKRSL